MSNKFSMEENDGDCSHIVIAETFMNSLFNNRITYWWIWQICLIFQFILIPTFSCTTGVHVSSTYLWNLVFLAGPWHVHDVTLARKLPTYLKVVFVDVLFLMHTRILYEKPFHTFHNFIVPFIHSNDLKLFIIWWAYLMRNSLWMDLQVKYKNCAFWGMYIFWILQMFSCKSISI